MKTFLMAMVVLTGFGWFASQDAFAQSPQGVQVNPIQVSVSPDKSEYNVGELITYNISINTNAFVYLFQFDASNSVIQLFPNVYQQDNFLSASVTQLPESNAYEYVAQQTQGATGIQIVAAASPIDFGTADFNQPFPIVGTFSDLQDRLIEASPIDLRVTSTSYFVNAPSSNTNLSPSASFNYAPANPLTGQLIEFDASFSVDPDGSIRQYQWDFTGDGVPDDSGVQASASFTGGNFDVTLIVTDDQGQSSTRTKTINVSQNVNQAPTAIFTTSPSQPVAGDLVLFDASGSRDTDGRIIQYLWDFENDGRTDAAGQRVVTRFNTAGLQVVSLTVVDDLGASNTRTQLITIDPGQVNAPPTASFTIDPLQPRIGELVTLNATSSRDTDGFIVNYQWDVDSDGLTDFSGSIIRVRFNDAGFSQIRLTVTDNGGASASTQQTIQVRPSDQPPVVNFTFSPSTVSVGQTVIFDATGSFDPDGFISLYQWDFQGDGVVDLVGPRVATRFNTAGTFRVVLTATDNQGNSTTAQQFVQVQQSARPPTASFTINPNPAIVNQPVTFDASASFDSDGFIAQYQWDFQSDGIVDATGRTVTVQFNNTGNTQVRLTVTDNDGLTGVSQQLLTVGQASQPPVASFTFSPPQPQVGQIITFNASNSSDSDGFISLYEWDFNGDGTVDATGISAQAQYSFPGSVQVILTVTDNSGITASTSQTINIQPVPPVPVTSMGEAVVWTNTVNVTANGNSLTKTGGMDREWDAGAFSVQMVTSGNAFVETTVAETTTNRMFGWSSGDDVNQHFSDIDFAAYLRPNGEFLIFERGEQVSGFASTYQSGDVIRVEIQGANVVFLKNGIELHVLTNRISSSNYPLRVDTSLHGANSTLQNVQIGLATTSPPPALSNDEPVIWINTVNVTANGNSLTKTGGVDRQWDAGAVSSQVLSSGDGFIQTIVAETTTNRMFGWSTGDANQHFSDIDFAAYLRPNGEFLIFERGDQVNGFASTYQSGDVVRVEIQGADVVFLKNGIVLHTLSNRISASNYPLRVDTSLHGAGATLQNVRMGTDTTPPAPALSSNEPVLWISDVNVTVNGNNLTKTGGVDREWDAGAVSAQTLVSGNGFVETTAAETTTNRMIGWSTGNTDQHFSDIDFAAYLRPNGELLIFERGVQVNGFSDTYQSGDVIRIEIRGANVVFLKNNVEVHTLTNKITSSNYPLRVDTSLHGAGATLENVNMGTLPTTI